MIKGSSLLPIILGRVYLEGQLGSYKRGRQTNWASLKPRQRRRPSSRFAVLEVLPCYPLKIANSGASGLQLRLGETILRDRNDHRQNSDDWSEQCLEESDHRLLSSWSRDGSHQ